METSGDKDEAELMRKFSEARGGEMPQGIKRMLELDPEYFERYKWLDERNK